ncbi:MAG: IF-2-associated domain-containing protein, partial [Alphaproteobacteria bacterium]|nr:IF-2-associated domain-containing protein [Alphaproteobacteria bacterium]
MSDENDKTNQGQGSGQGASQGNQGGTPSQTGPRAPLSLKPRVVGSVPTGTVKQSFSHGRSKTVVVETKRRPGAGGPQRPQGFDVARPQQSSSQNRPQGQRTSQPVGGALSPEEQEARRRAIAVATQANAERERAAVAEKAAREAAERERAAATERAAQAARDEAAAA